jgi:hypothetical protein
MRKIIIGVIAASGFVLTSGGVAGAAAPNFDAQVSRETDSESCSVGFFGFELGRDANPGHVVRDFNDFCDGVAEPGATFDAEISRETDSEFCSVGFFGFELGRDANPGHVVQDFNDFCDGVAEGGIRSMTVSVDPEVAKRSMTVTVYR